MEDEQTRKILIAPYPLSEEQSIAVLSPSRYIRLSAGAGTGKTETLTRRIVYLLMHENVKPQEIVAFTFTDKAAQSMKSRIYDEVESLGGKEACLGLGEMYIGTIHGFCLKVLSNSQEYGDFEVFDENQEMAFLLRRGWDLGLDREHYFSSCGSFIRSMGVVYNELLDQKEVEKKSPDFYRKFKVYEEVLRKNKRLSFSQQIYFAIRHIEENPASLVLVKHLIVDEYQDINRSQERLVELIGKNASVFVVGDPRQTIYRWRGSNENLFDDFSRMFGGAQELNLSENRRSAKNIIEAANELARRMGSKGEPLRPLKTEEGFVGEMDFGSKQEEAEWIVAQIKDMVEKGKAAYSDTAVLVRSVKVSGEPFINAFRKHGVPFIVGGNSGLFQRDEVQAVGRLFAWLSYKGFWQVGHGINRGEIRGEDLLKSALERWKTATGIALSEDSINNLRKWKENAEKDAFDAFIGAYYDLLVRLGYDSLDPENKVSATVMANLGKFSAILSDYDFSINFEGKKEALRNYFSNLCYFMNFYAVTSYDEQTAEDLASIDAVQLLTVHQAKGLEWRAVFIPSFMEGKFPQIKTGMKQHWDISEELFERTRYEGEEDDERRLFYVAATRAKDSLVISYYLDRKDDKRSRFLTEIEGTVRRMGVRSTIPIAEHRETGGEDIVNTFATGELIEYVRCPYFYRLRNVWAYKPEIAAPIGYGKSLHYCLKLLANGGPEKRTPEEVTAIVRKNFHLPFAPESLVTKLGEKAEKTLQGFVAKNSKDMDNIESVEVRVEFPMNRSTVVGRADVIINDTTKGGIEVRDYKTSDRVITKEESDLQVRLYAIGFEAVGKRVVLGSVANLEENEVRDLAVGKEELERAKKTADIAIEGISSGKFSPIPAEHCADCDFKTICTAGRNYLLHKEQSALKKD